MAKYDLLVDVHRGTMIESCHYGTACVINAEGEILASWGDTQQLVYPRSAIKSIQALPLVETGAAAALQVSDAELALACASHNGEDRHTIQVTDWLARLGLTDQALSCGAQKPSRDDTLKSLYRQDQPICPVHNNCSGKHSGFLTLARHMGWDLAGYAQRDHPVQQAIKQALSEMTESDLSEAPAGIDGCGIPVLAVPLEKMALAAARMAAAAGGHPIATMGQTRQKAARKIIQAQMAHPFNIAGTERYCTKVMQAAAGKVFLKVGAEGVYFAGIPEKGLGIAVKISDGASRAAEVVVGTLLHRYGGFGDVSAADIQSFIQPQMQNWVGTPVGHLSFNPAA